jgi:3-dehydrosphinganine reductase
LAAGGHDIAIFARDKEKLAQAASELTKAYPSVRVETWSVDVADASALAESVESAIASLGVPKIAIASAGIAEPGHFSEQPAELHRRHMDTNYFGALNFVHALRPAMANARDGQIGLVASGAAFFGIYGYSAYAPSKFALRGLAEILHLELAEDGISVTLCYPPDTDTPQLEAELRTKPEATKRITEGGGLMSADDVAKALLSGMAKGKFAVTPGVQMSLLNLLGSLVAPLLRWHQRRIIKSVPK